MFRGVTGPSKDTREQARQLYEQDQDERNEARARLEHLKVELSVLARGRDQSEQREP
jgi:hypothetical protein